MLSKNNMSFHIVYFINFLFLFFETNCVILAIIISTIINIAIAGVVSPVYGTLYCLFCYTALSLLLLFVFAELLLLILLLFQLYELLFILSFCEELFP